MRRGLNITARALRLDSNNLKKRKAKRGSVSFDFKLRRNPINSPRLSPSMFGNAGIRHFERPVWMRFVSCASSRFGTNVWGCYDQIHLRCR